MSNRVKARTRRKQLRDKIFRFVHRIQFSIMSSKRIGNSERIISLASSRDSANANERNLSKEKARRLPRRSSLSSNALIHKQEDFERARIAYFTVPDALYPVKTHLGTSPRWSYDEDICKNDISTRRNLS